MDWNCSAPIEKTIQDNQMVNFIKLMDFIQVSNSLRKNIIIYFSLSLLYVSCPELLGVYFLSYLSSFTLSLRSHVFWAYYEHRIHFDNLFVLFSCFFLLALVILCYFIFNTLFLFFCWVVFYFYFSYCIKYQSGLENIIIKLEIVDLLLQSNIKVSAMPRY